MNTFVLMIKKSYKILLFPYTFFLLYLMFFGFGRTQMDDNIVRLQPIFSTISFIQNNLLWNRFLSIFINVFGNIIMFIPFGFLGWVFPKFQNFKELLFSFLSVLIIVEALQYFSRMGVFDVDDILLNSLGVWIGFLICRDCKSQGKSNKSQI